MIHSREDKVDQDIIKKVEEIAKKNNVSMATIATAWVIKKGAIPIIGLSSKERIEQAVENAAFQLSPEDEEALEKAYVPKAIQGY